MSALARLTATFLAPADAEHVAGSAAPAIPAQTVAVIAAAEELTLAARVVTQATMARPGAGPALVCTWGAADPLPERLGWARCVVLPEDAALAHGAGEGACRTAPPGPLVLAVGGVRPPELDALLSGADAVIVAWRSERERPVAELAFRRACRPGQTGGVFRLPDGWLAAAVRRGGLGRTYVRDAEVLLQRSPRDACELGTVEVRHALAEASG